jgi:hypothetical protein
MTTQNAYRRFAATTLDVSKRAPDLATKTSVLVMADAWLDLAERTTQLVDHESDEAHMMMEQPLARASFQGHLRAAG